DVLEIDVGGGETGVAEKLLDLLQPIAERLCCMEAAKRALAPARDQLCDTDADGLPEIAHTIERFDRNCDFGHAAGIVAGFQDIPRVIEDTKSRLPSFDFWIRFVGMIRAGFLSAVDRADLIALARDGSAAHRLARRANALVLLDSGWSCERVAEALFVDDDTI